MSQRIGDGDDSEVKDFFRVIGILESFGYFDTADRLEQILIDHGWETAVKYGGL